MSRSGIAIPVSRSRSVARRTRPTESTRPLVTSVVPGTRTSAGTRRSCSRKPRMRAARSGGTAATSAEPIGPAPSRARARELAARRLLDAAGRDEDDVAEAEAGRVHHRVPDRVPEGVERGGVRLLRLDDGADVLRAARLVDDAERDRAARAHPGDVVDRRLDVLRRVLLPADDDQVLVARHEVQLVAGDVTEVAGVEPPVDEDGGG